MTKVTAVMIQEIIPQIMPALVEPSPFGVHGAATNLYEVALAHNPGGYAGDKPHKTKLRMPSTRIKVPRWVSKPPGAVPNWDGGIFMTR